MKDCPFCEYEGPSKVEDFDDVIVFAPLNPVVPGHLLVVPKAHVQDATVDPLLSARVMEVAAKRARQIGPGVNIITSVGATATQSVFHLHMHLIPRREGDGLLLPWSPSLVSLEEM